MSALAQELQKELERMVKDRLAGMDKTIGQLRAQVGECEEELAASKDKATKDRKAYEAEIATAREVDKGLRAEIRNLGTTVSELQAAVAIVKSPDINVQPNINVPKSEPNITVKPATVQLQGGKEWEITIPSVNGGPDRVAKLRRTD